jgi:hypothetical protein
MAQHASNVSVRESTQSILNDVETRSGIPVELVIDPKLETLAQLSRARGNAPFHLIRTNPTIGDPSYVIAYQCGFLLRFYDLAEPQRMDFASSSMGKIRVNQLVRQSGQTNLLPEDARHVLAEQLLGGLLTQLRSVPIGMRVDSWLYQQHPDLKDLQAVGIGRQLQDNLSVLGPEVRQFSPKAIWDASVSMNAAYAIFADRFFDQRKNVIPYRSTGKEKTGRSLLRSLEELSASPESDRALVDAWAAQLDLQDWYEWILAAQPAPTKEQS